MLVGTMYQMFWPNLGPSSVLDNYMAWCLARIHIYVQTVEGGVLWAVHGQEMCGRECCIL